MEMWVLEKWSKHPITGGLVLEVYSKAELFGARGAWDPE